MGRARRGHENQLTMLVEDPHSIIDRAWAEYGRRIIRRTAMLSGGDDSSTLAHWLAWHGYIDELLFLDTGIGLQGTRRFVRNFADHLGLPLQVWHAPPGAYETMVITITAGFPGPAAHMYAYQRLKERPLENYLRYCKRGWPRDSKVMLFSGIRRAESVKRMQIAEKAVESKGVRLWVAPFLNWTRADLCAWRDQHDIPSNDVAALLHFSGECLCGAHASEGELDFLKQLYPEDHAIGEILRLQRRADQLGIVRSRWGERWFEKASRTGPACGDCQMRLAALDTGPAVCGPRRPSVKVIDYGQRAPVTITARLHTPGRNPGPVAHEVHGVPFIELAAEGIHLGMTKVADFQVGEDSKLVLCDLNEDSEGPAARLLQQHRGELYTALDVTCKCTCERKRGRLPKNCNHQPGLAVWMVSEPLPRVTSTDVPEKIREVLNRIAELEDSHFTPGPIRVINGNDRRVFDHIRVINRELLLQDEVSAALILEGDTEHRSGAWRVPGMGLFRTVLIGREKDAQTIEQSFRDRGIEPGYRLPSPDSDYFEAVAVAARHPGDPPQPRYINALPEELWVPKDPTPPRAGRRFPRPQKTTPPTIGQPTPAQSEMEAAFTTNASSPHTPREKPHDEHRRQLPAAQRPLTGSRPS